MWDNNFLDIVQKDCTVDLTSLNNWFGNLRDYSSTVLTCAEKGFSCCHAVLCCFDFRCDRPGSVLQL